MIDRVFPPIVPLSKAVLARSVSKEHCLVKKKTKNPNSCYKLRNPVRNPESKTVLDSLTWGKAIKRAIPISIALRD